MLSQMANCRFKERMIKMPIMIHSDLASTALELVDSSKNRAQTTNEVGAMFACCAYYSLYEKTLPEAYALTPECAALYRLHCKTMDREKINHEKNKGGGLYDWVDTN